MKTFLSSLLVCFSLLVAALAYEPPKPVSEVEVVRFEWKDAKRDREVPVKIYYPKGLMAPAPVIVFSHGLGGSREGYEYLGRHWAGCGYVSVHLQHPGSDSSVWKNAGGQDRMKAMGQAAADVRNALARPQDVSFVIDQLEKLNADRDSPLAGKLDLKNIGMSGHSFGGHTTMTIAGQGMGPQGNSAYADPRVKCAIQMSAPAARPALRDKAYLSVKIPVFHMTGTLDDSPIGETKAEERRIPYDQMSGVETCLVIFKDGDHMIFSGRMRDQEAKADQDAVFHWLICASSTAYWDALLRGDKEAHAWLLGGGFTKQLGANGTFEKKGAAK